MAAYRALGEWARHAGAVSMTAWCVESGTPSLRSQLEVLERTLFSRSDSPAARDGYRLAAAFMDARKAWLASRDRSGERSPALPALNPSISGSEGNLR